MMMTIALLSLALAPISGREDPLKKLGTAISWEENIESAQALRTGALSDPTVGAFLSKHFRAAWMKVESFAIRSTDAAPAGQKEGGNVGAFFLTAELEVLHAVGGALRSSGFLKQAQWPCDLAELLKNAEPSTRRSIAAKAHESAKVEVLLTRQSGG